MGQRYDGIAFSSNPQRRQRTRAQRSGLAFLRRTRQSGRPQNGYRPPGAKDWTRIRLISDAGKYSRGVVDMYPAIGYVHQVRENLEFISGGPGWDETRVLVSSDGVAQGERRAARSKHGLSGAKWEPMSAGDAFDGTQYLNEAFAHLALDWSYARIGTVLDNVVTLIGPQDPQEICDAPITPAIQLRLELRKVRLNRVEGVLTQVEPIP